MKESIGINLALTHFSEVDNWLQHKGKKAPIYVPSGWHQLIIRPWQRSCKYQLRLRIGAKLQAKVDKPLPIESKRHQQTPCLTGKSWYPDTDSSPASINLGSKLRQTHKRKLIYKHRSQRICTNSSSLNNKLTYGRVFQLIARTHSGLLREPRAGRRELPDPSGQLQSEGDRLSRPWELNWERPDSNNQQIIISMKWCTEQHTCP